MSPTLDTVLVAAVVVAALGYLTRTWWGKKKPGCGGDCGCSVKRK